MFEDKIFLNESLKKQKQKLDWIYYLKELFSPEIISYTPKQINLIKDLLYSQLPNENRKDFWFISSGAKREMLNNPGYYNSILNNFPKGTQSPAENIIKLDVGRTFPHLEYFKKEENKKKLLRILTAFIRRNSTIGYSQGFNFIVARLLMVVEDEEKVFWIFTQIIEAYLPGDFFLLFSGVRKDMKIIEKMIKKKLTFFDNNIEICMSNLISKCFISLFSQIIPEKILHYIWDAFFIYGEIVLYRAFIWISFLHYDKSLINQDLEDINKIVIEKMKNTKDINSLFYFLYLDDSVNNNKIRKWRKKTEEKTLNETIPIWEADNNLKCDRNMPFCLYNKEENNIEKNKHFVVHKTNHEINIIKNYFSDENDNIKEKEEKNKNLNDNIIIKNEIINDLNISADSLLIERQKHICPEYK